MASRLPLPTLLIAMRCALILLMALSGCMPDSKLIPASFRDEKTSSKLVFNFEEFAEIGLKEEGKSPRSLKELADLPRKNEIRYLSLAYLYVTNFGFLKEFSNLELLILPMNQWMEDAEKSSLLQVLSEQHYQKRLVVLYSTYLTDFAIYNSNKMAFRSIHSTCEFYRIYAYFREVISFKDLMRYRRDNYYPIFKSNEKNPKLRGETRCE